MPATQSANQGDGVVFAAAASVLNVATSYAQWQAAHFSPEEIAGRSPEATGDFNSGGVLKSVTVEDAQDPAARPGRFLRLRIACP